MGSFLEHGYAPQSPSKTSVSDGDGQPPVLAPTTPQSSTSSTHDRARPHNHTHKEYMTASPPGDLHEATSCGPPLVPEHTTDGLTNPSVPPSPLNTNGTAAEILLHTASISTHLSSTAPSFSPPGWAQDARPMATTGLRDGQRRPRCRAAHISPMGARARHSTLTLSDTLEEAPPLTIVPSRALAIHLTKLRCRTTRGRPFRAAADRAIRLLLEEALAWAPIRPVEIITANHVTWSGISTIQPSCAMVMGERGYPLLEVFRTIQPETPAGFMSLEHDDTENVCGNNDNSSPGGGVTLRKLCAPVDFKHRNVFLLDGTCASAMEACVAIRSLLDFGARESSIFFVTLVISAGAVAAIGEAFPSAHIITAAVDPETAEDGEVLLGLGDFQERYFETTTIRQSNVGSVVDL